MSIKKVFCSFRIEGLHSWPECPIDEVYYLKDTHRHLFHIKAFKIVSHDNRDIEFIQLKHSISQYFLKYFDDSIRCCVFGSMSCEQIAQELIDCFGLCSCEVSEDGENGSLIEVI